MLCNVVLVSVIHQHESATGIHMLLPSSTSFPPPLYPRILFFFFFGHYHAARGSSLTRGRTHAPGGSDSKESACITGDPGSIPGSGLSPGVGTGYPLKYSCLENSIDRGAWLATVHGVTKSQT